MTSVHLVLPDTVDDPGRPSGGNVYDRHVADRLAARGRQVVEHRVADPALALPDIPDGALVIVDGLVASAFPEVLVPAAGRVGLVVLVHLPLGVDDPGARAAERQVLAVARTVVATSAWTRDWLGREYGLPDVRIAPPGVEPAPVAAGTAGGGALLVVGRVCRAKGYDVLAAALGTLTDLDWTCLWVGPTDQELSVRPGLTMAGALSHAAVAECYAAADLVVLPSRGETYGMVLAEALAHGVPVLASDVGGVREAVGRTADGRLPGLLVPPGDPAALAAQLRRWLTGPALRDDLRAAALARRATLTTWDHTVAQLLDALPDPVPGPR